MDYLYKNHMEITYGSYKKAYIRITKNKHAKEDKSPHLLALSNIVQAWPLNWASLTLSKPGP